MQCQQKRTQFSVLSIPVFKRQFKQDNSETVEAAVRRVKHDRYEFKSRGNKQQYEHEEDALEKMESAKDSVVARQLDRAKRSLDKGIVLVSNRMKLIKMADKSQYSWATVEELLIPRASLRYRR